ncbi:MAG: Hsp70 family protein, partial [Bdellovibrionales bacterium]|nr:Hsp70 family protein [Bdellovibrionales bacterium]
VPQIEVTFDIDANGMVHVNAKDLGTGKEQSIRITASGGLSEDEIQRMVKDAEAHKSDDEKKKKVVEARNMLDSLIYSLEKTLKDSADKVDAEDKKNVEAALVEAKKHLASEDLDTITKATEELTKASNSMAEKLYKQASADAAKQQGAGAEAHAGGGNGANGNGAHEQAEGDKKDRKKGGDDVIDADFKEV